MSEQHNKTLFPIRILAEKTAVGSSTLRAWERRYGLLKPHRTPKGHRLYSQADVERVNKIVDLLNDGHNHKAIAELLARIEDQTANPSNTSKTHVEEKPSTDDCWQGFIERSLAANSDFTIERLDSIYNEALAIYPEAMVTEKLILPLLERLGTAWQQHPERGIAEEHFYSSWLKHRLSARLHHAYGDAKGAKVICACLPGNHHEIGLLLFSISLLAYGYRVLYFGADLPLDQLAYITKRSAAKGIVLSGSVNQKNLLSLQSISDQAGAPLFIGGSQLDVNKINQLDAMSITALGDELAVAIKVFTSKLPAYSGKHQYSKQDLK